MFSYLKMFFLKVINKLEKVFKWTERDLNSRRLALQANALPTELSILLYALVFPPPNVSVCE